MENTLKRLLEAENQATEATAQAEAEAERVVRSTQNTVKAHEARFQERLPELREGHMEKANQRAEQSIKELERRHAERVTALRDAAENHEDEALDAAFERLLGQGGN